MIAAIATLTAASWLALPLVRRVRTDGQAWTCSAIGAACGLAAGALGFWSVIA